MHKAIELFAAICFVVIGFSHLLQPMVWVEFFAALRSQGRSGAFLEGFLCLFIGALIVSFHSLWSGLPAILTIIGVLLVLKSAVRFCAPVLALRIYERNLASQILSFRVGGIFSIAFGTLLCYVYYTP